MSLNIYDPNRWNNINTNLRDLILEKGPIKIYGFKFPKDQHLISLSTSLYNINYSKCQRDPNFLFA